MAIIEFNYSLVLAIAHIFFNPLMWNIVARKEWNENFVSKHFKQLKTAVYFLFVAIFSLGITRDLAYSHAVNSQIKLDILPGNVAYFLGGALSLVGSLLVLTSTYQLGIVGTYLGDYFGILMKEPVTAFPFNITSSPMYNGSCLNFLGFAILNQSPAGVFLTLIVFIVYQVALRFEDSFTAFIYTEKGKEKASKKVESFEKNRKKL